MAAGSSAMRVPMPRALLGSPLTALWLTAATGLVVWFEMRRHRETVFLANLGYSLLRLEGIVVAECLLLDAMLRLSFD
jgi:hypothetical protein